MFGFSGLINFLRPSPPAPASTAPPPAKAPSPPKVSRDLFETSSKSIGLFGGGALARSTAPRAGKEENTAARGAQGAAIHSGRVLDHDGRQRIRYDSQARSFPRTEAGSRARDALRTETRTRMTPFGRNLSEWLDRPTSARHTARATKTGAELAKSVNRPNPLWTRVGQVSKVTGRGFVVTGVGISAYNVATAPEGQRARVVTREAGAWTGAFAFGAAGAKGGALVGAVGGPLGAAIGAVVGGLAGGIAGAVGGTEVGDRVYTWWTKK